MFDFTSIPIGDLLGIMTCLVLSAFFSGSETALTHISLTRARHLIDSKPAKFGILRFWLDHKRRLLAALLVGNNLVNILCSVLVYRVAVLYTNDWAEAISVFGLTLVILVVSEITPKSLALHYSEQLVIPVLRIMWLVDKLLWIVTTPLVSIPQFFLDRSDSGRDEPQLTEGEIEFQIRLGHDRKVFEEKEQGELLMSAVEFQAIAVKEIMLPRTDIFGLDVSTPLAQAFETAVEEGHSRIPVYESDLDHIIGILYMKDLLRIREGGREHDPAIDLDSVVRKPPFFAPETRMIADVLTEMKRKRLHMAIVVDEFGGTSGLITLEDIIEELVGDIRDEFDEEDAMIKKVDASTWRIDARLTLLDLEDETGVALPDTGDYESVGGFVVAQHGSIPKEGSVVTTPGVRITVLSADARRVRRLELKVTGDGGAES